MNAIFRAVRAGDPEPLLPAQPPAPAQGHRLLRQHRLRPEGAALAPPQPDRFRRDRGLQRLRRASGPSASSRSCATTGRCSTSAGATPPRAAATRTASSFTGPGTRARWSRVDPHAAPDADERQAGRPARRRRATSRRGTPPSRAARSSSSSSAGARPGDEVLTTDETRPRAPARPRGAVGRRDARRDRRARRATVVQTFDVPSRPTRLGAEERHARGGRRSARSASTATSRCPSGPTTAGFRSSPGASAAWTTSCPSCPCPPLGFTNPVYVVRHPGAAAAVPRSPARRPALADSVLAPGRRC